MRALTSQLQRGLVRRLHLDTVQRLLGGLSASLVRWLAITSLTAIFAIFAFDLFASRLDVREAARMGAGNIATAVAQQIARDVELLDLSLQDLRDGAGNPAVTSLPDQLKPLVLFDRAATAHGLGALLLLDERGRVVEQAGRDQPPPLELGTEAFFKVHLESRTAGLFVSRPFVSLIDGEPCIALSRRVERDGQFIGVAVATIKTSYFQELFSMIDLGPKGSITLMARDGSIIARKPFAKIAIGQVIAPATLVQLFASTKAGTSESVSLIDGMRRLFVHTQVGSLPLVVVLGRSTEEIYAPWWRRTAWTGLALLLLGNVMLVLIASLQIALKQRAAAEAELEKLARTDKLTGLANRRRFDECLDQAWRHAARHRQPLALLMLDIDHFKAFNDTFGHQGGDAALAGIGACLARIPQRPFDLVARYGGEEFAVLLPDTSEAGALRIAGTIESEVRTLRPHPGSSTAMLTVSIGVAVAVPEDDGPSADLVRSADESLYAAKRAGRNRTVLWTGRRAA